MEREDEHAGFVFYRKVVLISCEKNTIREDAHAAEMADDTASALDESV